MGTKKERTEKTGNTEKTGKKLYLIGGPMGVGKTTVGQILKKMLPDCVYLDGDWCWDMDPFIVTEETKHMVIENICALLNNFLKCDAYQNVVFCWVMHEQGILNDIMSRLNNGMPLKQVQCEIRTISLVCEEDELKRRIRQDVEKGRRDSSVLEKSIAYLPLYETLDTVKIDVTGQTPGETAKAVVELG